MRVITFIDTRNAYFVYLHTNDRRFKIYVTDQNIVPRLQECMYNYFYGTIDPNLSQIEIPSKIMKLTESAVLNIINYYEKCDMSNPIKYNIATLYHFIGYENYATSAYRSCKGNSDAIRNLGWIARDKMDYDAAIEYYKNGLRMGNFDCATELGLYYYKIRNYKKMKKYYRLGIDHGIAACYERLGFYYKFTKRYDLMDKHYLAAIKHNYIPALTAYCLTHADEPELIKPYIQILKNLNYPVYGIFAQIAEKKNDEHSQIKYYVKENGNVFK